MKPSQKKQNKYMSSDTGTIPEKLVGGDARDCIFVL
jgi:hypothetical protein